MASSLSSPIAAAAVARPSSYGHSRSLPSLFAALRFPSSPKGIHRSLKILTAVARAQSKEVAGDGSLNAAASGSGSKDAPPPARTASEESISELISQVADLVKLVDSRDIAELQLKQLDCELLIRKKEALPQPQTPALPPMVYQSPVPSNGLPASSAPVQAPVAAPAPTPSPAPSSLPSPSADSSLPPLKCPMAGTFYRNPGPGEPPFVKKGDKVQKGQVLCIIEAMKLMNEIEADQSGTIVDILAEDGKPVSLDMPLFIIKP
ncbi:hypothetical protein MLD38_035803 [Melastoma candidum]|uniref:Uncharacterized protein n=1 Tax=Melastoma candidum TaxID=119954 RepID=A0ACB9LHQ9_9MYRT|nr:hypothetical protein MLD38_035803 [Melastoma candidum]